ncbi:hypothetical protein O1L55_20805 [Streptomyces albulus]|nr:hypothetical protein [Streptomyces noursei]
MGQYRAVLHVNGKPVETQEWTDQFIALGKFDFFTLSESHRDDAVVFLEKREGENVTIDRTWSKGNGETER